MSKLASELAIDSPYECDEMSGWEEAASSARSPHALESAQPSCAMWVSSRCLFAAGLGRALFQKGGRSYGKVFVERIALTPIQLPAHSTLFTHSLTEGLNHCTYTTTATVTLPTVFLVSFLAVHYGVAAVLHHWFDLAYNLQVYYKCYFDNNSLTSWVGAFCCCTNNRWPFL